MKTIGILKNPIQAYAWGSPTAIPELLGEAASGGPQAELWMGAHPKAPSLVECGNKRVSLLDLIDDHPEDILGIRAAEKFNNRLPFLFKVLAAAQPLSIQAHPSRKQAREGFERENRLGVPLDAPGRNYRDASHKPECICALTPYWALNGFRSIPDMLSLMDQVRPAGLSNILRSLGDQPDSRGLKDFFKAVMSLDSDQRLKAVDTAVDHAGKLSGRHPIFEWMLKLHKAYPGDIGIFAPIILNLVCLEPGQAMFLPAGELHAYLDGLGIELMANSDNVLRGGLTPKHVDVPELLKVLNFEERTLEILSPVSISETETVYKSLADEFVLSVVSVGDGTGYSSPADRSADILLCTEGNAIITDTGSNDTTPVSKGTCVIVPSAVKQYVIDGRAVLYKAGVPL